MARTGLGRATFLEHVYSGTHRRQERGRVLNESWARSQAISPLAMVVSVARWRLGGLKEAESDLDTTLAGIKNY